LSLLAAETKLAVTGDARGGSIGRVCRNARRRVGLNAGVAASSESPSVKGRTGAAAYTIAAGQYL